MDINDILNQLDNIRESEEDLDEPLERIKEKIDQNTELNEERVDLNNNLYALQKLCLFYEDLANRNEETTKCSLMNAAFNDLAEPTYDFIRFTSFFSENKKKLLTYNGSKELIEELHNQIRDLNKRIINSKEGKSLDVNFIE